MQLYYNIAKTAVKCFYKVIITMDDITKYYDWNLFKISVKNVEWMLKCGTRQYHDILECNFTAE